MVKVDLSEEEMPAPASLTTRLRPGAHPWLKREGIVVVHDNSESHRSASLGAVPEGSLAVIAAPFERHGGGFN